MAIFSPVDGNSVFPAKTVSTHKSAWRHNYKNIGILIPRSGRTIKAHLLLPSQAVSVRPLQIATMSE
jgi:hypothetical protein